MKNQNKFSVIIPVAEKCPAWLGPAVISVVRQTDPDWELIVIAGQPEDKRLSKLIIGFHDSRIQIITRRQTATMTDTLNEALAAAGGDYVTFINESGRLDEQALAAVSAVIKKHRPDIIYADESHPAAAGISYDHNYKPDYSPDYLLAANYICHPVFFSKSLVMDCGGFRPGFEAVQDYDLILRAVEKARRVEHIPRVLYVWSNNPKTAAAERECRADFWRQGKKALEEALSRRGIAGEVLSNGIPQTFRVRRRLEGEPLVSIIIPFRDQPVLLERCLDSILKKSSYRNFEIIGVNNQSGEEKTRQVLAEYQKLDARIKFVDYNRPFNYSLINNYAVQLAAGEHLVLLNSDVEIISPDWIESLLEHSQRPEVGAVGAKLIHRGGTIQHAGVIIGILGCAGHAFYQEKVQLASRRQRLMVTNNFCAVTAALMMVKKHAYLAVGGLDKNLPINFNDVDFCLRLLENGCWNIFTPYCQAYHAESSTRGRGQHKQLGQEIAYFQKRHRAILEKGDPFYNPNFSLGWDSFTLRQPPAYRRLWRKIKNILICLPPVYGLYSRIKNFILACWREIMFFSFDWRQYLDAYPDLKVAGITSRESAIWHWRENGRREGRVFFRCQRPVDKIADRLVTKTKDYWSRLSLFIFFFNFDWRRYVAFYHDLLAEGVDTREKAKLHWVNCGRHEDRIAFLIIDPPFFYKKLKYLLGRNFDWEGYLEKYPDLRGAGINSWTKALDHWIKRGSREGRVWR